MNTQPAAPTTATKPTLTPVEQYLVGVLTRELAGHANTLHRFVVALQALVGENSAPRHER